MTACLLFNRPYSSPFLDAAIRHANWDASKVREKLRRDIDGYASSVRSAKLSEIIANYEVIFLANAQIVAVIAVNGFVLRLHSCMTK